MYRRRKYRQKRRGRGLLGANWAKKYKILRPYLERRKQKGGSFGLGRIINWGVKKLAKPNNPLSNLITNPNAGVKFLNKVVDWI